MQPQLQVDNLECRQGDNCILEQVSFTLNQGEIASLLGPSGCGKTTLLHAIAGFQPVYAGAIQLGQNTLSTPDSTTPPELRHIGVVFQDYALFPHLTVQQNIAFGLQGLHRGEIKNRVGELLQLIRMAQFSNHFPHQLSGGQQQRVALARALAPKPKLLLMDEPFSNLDSELRRSLAEEVRQILLAEGITALIVTHDRSEAFLVADQIGVLGNGKLQQWAEPQILFHSPISLPVAKAMDEGELFYGQVGDDGVATTELGAFQLDIRRWRPGSVVEVFVRNTSIAIGDHQNAVNALVIGKYFLGNSELLRFRLAGGREIEAKLNIKLTPALGTEIRIYTEDPLIFPNQNLI